MQPRVPMSPNAGTMQQKIPHSGERAVEARSTLQSTVASNSVLRSSVRHFYLWMAGVLMLIGFFSLAIANVRRPETHKRLMYLIMVGFMHPAIARVMLTLFAPPGAQGPPPVFVAVPPGLIADLLIVVAMIYDWRTRGRPHHVYVYGGLTLLADQLMP